MKNNIRKIIKEEITLKEISTKDIEKSRMYGGELETVEQLGNGYELALFSFGGNMVVALTHKDQSFTDLGSQEKKPTDSDVSDIIKVGKKSISVIKNWLSKYRILHVGTTNKKRSMVYHNILSREFQVSPINQQGYTPEGEPQYVFSIR